MTSFNFLHTESFTLKQISSTLWVRGKLENMQDLQIKKQHVEKLIKNPNRF